VAPGAFARGRTDASAPTEACSNYEICNSICVAGAGVSDRGDGVGIDGDAVCHSWARGRRASAGGACSGGSGAGGGGPWTANFDRAAILQSANSRGENHVATAVAGNEGAARLAGTSCPESRTNAGNDSGCNGPERARGGIEYPATRARCRVDGAGAGPRHPGRSGTGAESDGERDAGHGTEDQFAGDDGRGAAGVCDAELCRTVAGQREPDFAGCGLQIGECDCGCADEPSYGRLDKCESRKRTAVVRGVTGTDSASRAGFPRERHCVADADGGTEGICGSSR